MNEWISVKDRMPQEGIQVLCFAGGKLFGMYIIAELITGKDGCTGWEIYGREEHDAGFGSISHWMELPEPPK